MLVTAFYICVVPLEWQVQELKSFDFDNFEKKLAKKLEGEFRGRKRLFDHTLEVVGNMKKIVAREGGKMDVLVTIAYLHELATPVYRGDSAVVFEGRSFLQEKCVECGRQARGILDELKFPQEKLDRVVRCLELNDCLELKRAHHNIP